MKQVYRFDENGFYIGPVLLEETEKKPNDCTEIAPPNGLYKGKFLDGRWVETMAQTEIEEMNNTPKNPTPDEKIAALEVALTESKTETAQMNLAIIDLWEMMLG